VFAQLLNTLRDYNKEKLRKDIIAGLSVAAISLPQNMAYALIVGVEPIYGIYATIVSMIIFTFVGQSNYMIVGPTNIMAMALASSIADVSHGNYIEALLLLTFLVGLCQILFGILKLGRIVNYVSHSLIVGLSTGAVIMIGVGQLQNFLGLSVDGGPNLFTRFYVVLTNLEQINYTTLFIGILTVLLIITIKRINDRWPAYLIAIVIVTIIVYIFDLSDNTEIVGSLPEGIIKFNMLNFDWNMVTTLISKGISIAFLGLIQTLAVVKSLNIYTREEVDINNEFVGQGIINLMSSFFNGFATAGSFAKSFANIQAGAVTRFAQLFTGIAVICFLLLLKNSISYVPVAGLAGLVIAVAIGSVKVEEIKRNLDVTKGDAIIFIVTFLSIISLPVIDTAVYIGLLTSIMVILKKTEIIHLGVIKYDENNDNKFSQQEVGELSDQFEKEHFIVLNLRGNLHFSSVNNLKEKFEIVLKRGDNFVIRLREIERIDLTIMRELDIFIDKVHKSNGRVILSGIDKVQYDRLKRYGIIKKIKDENVYFSDNTLFSSTKDAYDFMDVN